MIKTTKSNGEKPEYVTALEVAYGPPSQEAFGSAVFFEDVPKGDDLEDVAQKVYQYFVGHLWEEWGAEAWMTPWEQIYARKAGAKRDVVKELKGIAGLNARNSVPLIIDKPQAAIEALAAAYDAPETVDFRVYTIGDGEAMSGLLLAGQRENGEATFLIFLLD